jgi:hypothetical protein
MDPRRRHAHRERLYHLNGRRSRIHWYTAGLQSVDGGGRAVFEMKERKGQAMKWGRSLRHCAATVATDTALLLLCAPVLSGRVATAWGSPVVRRHFARQCPVVGRKGVVP